MTAWCQWWMTLSTLAITNDYSLDKEINVRIRKASRSFNSLYKVLWRQRGVKVKTKMRICKSVVPPTLLYGSETWTPTATHIRRLQGLMMKCTRVILAVSVRDERRNTELRAVAGMERLEVVLMRRRLRWLAVL